MCGRGENYLEENVAGEMPVTCVIQLFTNRIVSHSVQVLSLLPMHAQLAFPAVLSKRLGLDVHLLYTVHYLRATGVSFDEIAGMIREAHQLQYDLQKYSYHSLHVHEKAHSAFHTQPEKFSKFDDFNGYAGHLVSGMCPVTYIIYLLSNSRLRYYTVPNKRYATYVNVNDVYAYAYL